MRSFWMLGASFFFALMAAFVKMGASHFSFFELVGYRSLFGVILIGGWIFATHRTIRTPYIFGHFTAPKRGKCDIGGDCAQYVRYRVRHMGGSCPHMTSAVRCGRIQLLRLGIYSH